LIKTSIQPALIFQRAGAILFPSLSTKPYTALLLRRPKLLPAGHLLLNNILTWQDNDSGEIEGTVYGTQLVKI
jgi:hypothetical protein